MLKLLKLLFLVFGILSFVQPMKMKMETKWWGYAPLRSALVVRPWFRTAYRPWLGVPIVRRPVYGVPIVRPPLFGRPLFGYGAHLRRTNPCLYYPCFGIRRW